MKKKIILIIIFIVVAVTIVFALNKFSSNSRKISDHSEGEDKNIFDGTFYDKPGGLSSCGDKKEFFTVAPLAMSDFTSIIPLGNFSPSGHIFPTGHTYLNIKSDKPNSRSPITNNVPLYSPGDIHVSTVKSIDKADKNGKHIVSDYSITFYACDEFKGYFNHARSLSGKLKEKFDEEFSGGSCDTYMAGGDNFKSCEVGVDVKIEAGGQMGTVGGEGQTNFDFGARDLRSPEIKFANPKRWYKEQSYVVCPYDYYAPGLRDELSARMGYGSQRRTVDPVCGTVDQDIPGTARGIWFKKGTKETYPEDEHLTLSYDNINPEKGAFSVGTAMQKSGLSSALYYFNPAASGLANRKFDQVTPDGNIYCYKTSKRGMPPEESGYVILVKLLDEKNLRMERQSINSCGAESWSFGSNYTDYER